ANVLQILAAHIELIPRDPATPSHYQITEALSHYRAPSHKKHEQRDVHPPAGSLESARYEKGLAGRGDSHPFYQRRPSRSPVPIALYQRLHSRECAPEVSNRRTLVFFQFCR